MSTQNMDDAATTSEHPFGIGLMILRSGESTDFRKLEGQELSLLFISIQQAEHVYLRTLVLNLMG